MRKSVAALLSFLLLSAATLSACNTTAGAGRDLSSAGHKITNEAEEHR